MSDSYIKDRARLHAMHRWAWLTLALTIAGIASLYFGWGEDHLGNVVGLWWAKFLGWVGAPWANTNINGMYAPAGLILSSLANDPNHPFWQMIVTHSRQLVAVLVAAPMLSAIVLTIFKVWKKSNNDDDTKVKRGAEILDAKELTKQIKKTEK